MLGQAFHCSCKPPFSWFTLVIVWASAIAHTSCQGLEFVKKHSNHKYLRISSVSVAVVLKKKFVQLYCWTEIVVFLFLCAVNVSSYAVFSSHEIFSCSCLKWFISGMLSGLIAYGKTTYNLSVNFSVKNIFLSGSRIVSTRVHPGTSSYLYIC